MQRRKYSGEIKFKKKKSTRTEKNGDTLHQARFMLEGSGGPIILTSRKISFLLQIIL